GPVPSPLLPERISHANARREEGFGTAPSLAGFTGSAEASPPGVRSAVPAAAGPATSARRREDPPPPVPPASEAAAPDAAGADPPVRRRPCRYPRPPRANLRRPCAYSLIHASGEDAPPRHAPAQRPRTARAR